ncbi:hypothetical protein Tco_1184404 [Tanacetum coccineum]
MSWILSSTPPIGKPYNNLTIKERLFCVKSLDVAAMSVVYVLTTHISEDGDDATVEQIRKRAKWDNDDYV